PAETEATGHVPAKLAPVRSGHIVSHPYFGPITPHKSASELLSSKATWPHNATYTANLCRFFCFGNKCRRQPDDASLSHEKPPNATRTTEGLRDCIRRETRLTH